MGFHRLIRITLPAWAIVAVLGAQTAPDEIEARDIRACLAALGAEDFEKREAATASLLARGERARAPIEAALSTLPLEARLRAELILQGLSEPKRRAVFRTEPRRVRLDLDGVPLDEAIQRFARIGATRMRMAGPLSEAPNAVRPATQHSRAQRPVTFLSEDLPFLEALDRFCEKTGLMNMRDYQTGDILLSEGRPDDGITRYVGPFKVSLTSLMITVQSRFSGNPTTSASIQVRIDAEPDLDLVGLLQPVKPKPAKDDQDRDIVFQGTNSAQQYLNAADGRRQFHIGLFMEPPAKDAKSIRSLELPVEFVVPDEIIAGELILRAPDGIAEPDKSPSALDLRVDSMQPSPQGTSVSLSFVLPVPSGDRVIPGSVRWEDIEIVDADGARVPFQRSGQQEMNGRSVRMLTLLGASKEPLVAQVRALSRYRVARIDVPFADIPLP